MFPDHIRIGLGNSYVVLAKVSGNKVTYWRTQNWLSTPEAPTTQYGWQHSMDIAIGWLTELDLHNASVQIILSTELGLLHLLPWRDDVQDVATQAIIANSYFSRVHSNFSPQWKTAVEPTGFGQPWIASTVDNELLQSLNESLNANSCKLKSVELLSLSIYNHVRNYLDKTACWLLVSEPAKLNAIHLRNGNFQLLCTLPTDSFQHESINSVLLRESRLAGLPDMPSSIFIAATKKASDAATTPSTMIDAGWKFAPDVVPSVSPLYLIGAPS